MIDEKDNEINNEPEKVENTPAPNDYHEKSRLTILKEKIGHWMLVGIFIASGTNLGINIYDHVRGFVGDAHITRLEQKIDNVSNEQKTANIRREAEDMVVQVNQYLQENKADEKTAEILRAKLKILETFINNKSKELYGTFSESKLNEINQTMIEIRHVLEVTHGSFSSRNDGKNYIRQAILMKTDNG